MFSAPSPMQSFPSYSVATRTVHTIPTVAPPMLCKVVWEPLIFDVPANESQVFSSQLFLLVTLKNNGSCTSFPITSYISQFIVYIHRLIRPPKVSHRMLFMITFHLPLICPLNGMINIVPLSVFLTETYTVIY